MAFVDFKDLPRRTASDKILRDKTFNIAKNTKNYGYQRDLVSMVYIFLIKRLKMKMCQTKNYLKNYTKQLLENLKNEKYAILLKTIFRALT